MWYNGLSYMQCGMLYSIGSMDDGYDFLRAVIYRHMVPILVFFTKGSFPQPGLTHFNSSMDK